MQSAASKQQLLDQLHSERNKWQRLLDEIGKDRLELPGVTERWTMKDTIAHLTTWWRREIAMLAAVKRGERPPVEPPQ